MTGQYWEGGKEALAKISDVPYPLATPDAMRSGPTMIAIGAGTANDPMVTGSGTGANWADITLAGQPAEGNFYTGQIRSMRWVSSDGKCKSDILVQPGDAILIDDGQGGFIPVDRPDTTTPPVGQPDDGVWVLLPGENPGDPPFWDYLPPSNTSNWPAYGEIRLNGVLYATIDEAVAVAENLGNRDMVLVGPGDHTVSSPLTLMYCGIQGSGIYKTTISFEDTDNAILLENGLVQDCSLFYENSSGSTFVLSTGQDYLINVEINCHTGAAEESQAIYVDGTLRMTNVFVSSIGMGGGNHYGLQVAGEAYVYGGKILGDTKAIADDDGGGTCYIYGTVIEGPHDNIFEGGSFWDNFEDTQFTLNSLSLNNSPVNVPGTTPGVLSWNSTEGTVDLQMGFADAVLQLGQEVYAIVYNNTGSQLNNGKAVYVTGQYGGDLTVALAKADTHLIIENHRFVTTMDIPIGERGLVTRLGKVRNLDTSMWTAGTKLWISDTVAGDLTDTMPVFPSYAVHIAGVLDVHASTGSIYADAAGGGGGESSYLQLDDTEMTFVGASKKIPAVNADETFLEWIANSIFNLDEIDEADFVGHAGQVLRVGYLEDEANFGYSPRINNETDAVYVDTDSSGDLVIGTNTADRLIILDTGEVGIGTPTPGGNLEVVGPLPTRIERAFTSDGSSSRSVLQLRRSYDGGAGSAGIGAHIDFYVETTVEGTDESIGQLKFATTDATQGAVDSSFALTVVKAGVFNQALTILSNGFVGINEPAPTETLCIVNTGTGATLRLKDPDSVAVIVLFNATDAPPADTPVGKLNFQGYNDAAEDISYGNVSGWVADDTDGSEDGYVSISTRQSGSISEVLRATQDGDVEIAGQIKITGGSPGANKVLTSDANGLATWETPIGADSDWTIVGSDMYGNVAGNVGIGTTSPKAKLDVRGEAFVGAVTTSAWTTQGTNGLLIDNYGSSARLTAASTGAYNRNITIRALDAGTPVENQLFIRYTGNVGIGTDAPKGKLHVMAESAGTVSVSSVADTLVIEDSVSGGITILTPDSANGNIFFGTPSDTAGAIIRWQHNSALMSIGTANDGASLRFWSGNVVEAMRIDSTGKAGIGFTSMTYQLEVAGRIRSQYNAGVGNVYTSAQLQAYAGTGGANDAGIALHKDGQSAISLWHKGLPTVSGTFLPLRAYSSNGADWSLARGRGVAVYRTSTQSIAANAWIPITFQAAAYQASDDNTPVYWTTGNYIYVRYDGWYLVTATAALDSVPDAKWGGVRIYHNVEGTIGIDLARNYSTGAIYKNCTAVIYVEAGTRFQLQVYVGTTATTFLAGNEYGMQATFLGD